MGCDDALDSNSGGNRNTIGTGGALNKHSPLSATVTNLAADPMDVDDDYPDYADSDDYQYWVLDALLWLLSDKFSLSL